jgi:regulator of cell morphogenesis and NO signaling
MTESLLESTVAELVLEKPSRSRIFTNAGIDYCCGGKRTLKNACQSAQIDSKDLLTAIATADQEPDTGDENQWQALGLTLLADHIVATHHAFLREELPRIHELVERVVAAHGENRPNLHEVRQLYQLLVQDLMPHMMKEEQVLFPIIRQLDSIQSADGPPPQFHCGSVNNPIRAMEHEHQTVGDCLRNLRALTDDFTPPTDACPTYHAMLDALQNLEKDLHTHIHKENNILFPKAAELEARVQASSTGTS